MCFGFDPKIYKKQKQNADTKNTKQKHKWMRDGLRPIGRASGKYQKILNDNSIQLECPRLAVRRSARTMTMNRTSGSRRLLVRPLQRETDMVHEELKRGTLISCFFKETNWIS